MQSHTSALTFNLYGLLPPQLDSSCPLGPHKTITPHFFDLFLLLAILLCNLKSSPLEVGVWVMVRGRPDFILFQLVGAWAIGKVVFPYYKEKQWVLKYYNLMY